MNSLLRSSGLDAAVSKKPSLRFAAAISLVIAALMFSSCSKGAGAHGMSLKWPGMNQKEMPVKSGYAYGVTKYFATGRDASFRRTSTGRLQTFSDINNKISTAPSYRVYAASYDLDAANFSQTMDKPLPSDNQIRITFSLVGDQGGNEKSPLKAGEYSAKADKFMKVETAGIVTRKDGKDDTLWLDPSALTGNVKVTSVAGDSITGEANLTDGQSAIKGPFTAKILVRK
jgi:hypothetical protein